MAFNLFLVKLETHYGAARGVGGRLFPWGDDEPTCVLANYSGCSGDTTSVASHPRGTSPYGIHNMAGNVLEWVADWYDENYYSTSPSDSPAGPATGRHRVLRGGSWLLDEAFTRTTLRSGLSPTMSTGSIGFRCAKDAR